MFIYSPLEQFKILPIIPVEIFGVNVSFTNSSFVSILITLLILQATYTLSNSRLLLANNFVWVMLKIDQFVESIILSQIGKIGLKFKPLLLTIFLVILFSNFIGLIPYSFTITSHPIITMGLSFSLWLGITIMGILLQKFHFINIFIPSGVPTPFIPFVFTIEVISYLTRPVSLGLRLAANMLAGHTLLNIISFFIWQMYTAAGILLPLALVSTVLLALLIVLELLIAFLQTYVFTVLVASYINDIYNHH